MERPPKATFMTRSTKVPGSNDETRREKTARFVSIVDEAGIWLESDGFRGILGGRFCLKLN